MTGAYSTAYAPAFDTLPVPSTTRQLIADALTGIDVTWDGKTRTITGYPSRPAALSVWQGFCDWTSTEWRTRCVPEDTWAVYVVLPAADPESWATARDAVIEPIRDRLSRLGQVQRCQPVALVVADQSLNLPALNFTLLT